MSLRLYSHVMNDIELAGSPLERFHFYWTIPHIIDFLTQGSENRIPDLGEKQDAFRAACEKSLPIFWPFLSTTKKSLYGSFITGLPSGHLNWFKDKIYHYLAQGIINQYNQRGRVFVPGGWSGNDGHAMIYEFKKAENSDLLILIWNTGCESDKHHLSEEVKEGTFYAPVKVFRIAYENQRWQEDWKECLAILFKCHMRRSPEEYDRVKGEDIYNSFYNFVESYHFEEQDPLSFCQTTTQGQWSATCAWKSILELTTHYGFEEFTPEEVQYEIMRFTHQKYFEIIKPDCPKNIGITNQLMLGNQNFIHALREVSEKGIISPERQAVGFALYEKIDQELLEIAQTHLAVVPPSNPVSLSTPLETFSDPFRYIPYLSPQNVTGTTPLKPTEYTELEPLTTFEEFKIAIREAASPPTLENGSFHHFRQMENLLFQLPLDRAFWETASKSDLQQCVIDLANVVINFAKHVEKHAFKLYMRHLLALKCIEAATSLMVSIIFDDNPAILEDLIANDDPNIFSCEQDLQDFITDEFITQQFKKLALFHSSTSMRKYDIYGVESRDTFHSAIIKRDPSLVSSIQKNIGSTIYLDTWLSLRGFGVEERNKPFYYYCFWRFPLKRFYPHVESELQCAYSKRYLHDIIKRMCGTNQSLALKRDFDYEKYILRYGDQGYSAFVGYDVNFHGLHHTASHSYFRNYSNETYYTNLKAYEPRESENAIQLRSYDHDSKWKHHLYSKSKSQVISTIEYLRSHITELSQTPETQALLFAMIFHKTLLAQELQDNLEAVFSLIECIEKGLSCYSVHKFPQARAHFFMLSVFLERYIASYIHAHRINAPAVLHEMFEKLSTLNEIMTIDVNSLEYCENQKEKQTEIIAVYHALKIIHLQSAYWYHGQLSKEEWSTFCILNYLVNTFSKLPMFFDKVLTIEMKYARNFLRCHFDKQIAEHCLNYLLLVSGTELKEPLTLRAFPLYETDTMSINLLEGVISTRHFNTLPEFITTDPTFTKHFGQSVSTGFALDKTGKNFQLSHPYENYRVFKTERYTIWSRRDLILIIQKKINTGAREEWYQLIDEAEIISNAGDYFYAFRAYQLAERVFSYRKPIPYTLTQNPYTLWKKEDGSLLVIDESEKIHFMYDNVNKKIYRVNEQLVPEAELIYLPEVYQTLEKFEDARFIEIWQSKTTSHIEILLPRYSLKFMSENGSPFRWSEDQDYYLMLNSVSPVKRFETHLTLSSNRKDDVLHIIPKQPFIFHQQAIDDYPRVDHDIRHKPFSRTIIQKENPEKDKRNDFLRLVKYSDTEHYAIFQPSKEAILIPKNNRDAPLLGTLYFVTRNFKEAFTTLQSIQNTLHLTKEEINYLEAICSCSIEMIRTPLAASIRLLAAAILHECNHASNHTQAIVKEYLAMLAFIPKAYRLSGDVVHSLSAKTDQEKSFAMSLFAQDRKLKRLSKNLRYLTQRQSHTVLSDREQARLDRTQQKLSKNYTLIPTRDSLTKQWENPPDWRSDFVFRSECKLKSEHYSLDELIENPRLDYILNHFVELFEEARGNEEAFKKLVALIKRIHNYLVIKQHDRARYFSMFEKYLENPEAFEKLLVEKKPSINDGHYKGFKKGEFASIFGDAPCEIYTQKYIPMPSIPHVLEGPSYVREASAKNEIVPLTPPALPDLEALLNGIGLGDLFDSMVDVSEIVEPLFDDIDAEEGYVKELLIEVNQDYEAGVQQNRVAQRVNDHLYATLNSQKSLKKLKAKLFITIHDRKFLLDDLEKEIVRLLNLGPSDPIEATQWKINLASGAEKTLTLQDAFHYFEKYTPSDIVRKRQLSPEQAAQLFSLIYSYLIEGTQTQQFERAFKLLAPLVALSEAEFAQPETKNDLVKLGKALTQKRAFDPATSPVLLVFEYRDNKLIYDFQYDIIQKMTARNNDYLYQARAVRLIMGGGKSKIILPILARLLPDGTNLVFIESPEELFQTLYRDLKDKSGHIYHQTVYPFVFQRDTKVDSRYFYELRLKFKQLIAKKGVVLTTRDSTDSLKHRYIELLNNPPMTNIDEWVKQVKYLGDIIAIMKHQGIAVLDEMDAIQNPFYHLIYTLFDGVPEKPEILEGILDLYCFMKNIPHVADGEVSHLYDIATESVTKPTKQTIKQLLKNLRHELVFSQDSPLYYLVASLKDAQKEELYQFFAKSNVGLPEFAQSWSNIDKDLVSIYKENLKRLLRLSISRNQNEHFGLSHDEKKEPVEQEKAIPYKSSNMPNEQAQFKNHLLSIDYTIQLQLKKPLSRYLLTRLLTEFKRERDEELIINTHLGVTESVLQEKFNKIVGSNDIILDEINLNSATQKERHYERLKHCDSIKHYCLKNYILPSILSTPKSISANPQNHVEMYQTVMGFCGDDYNFRTFHPSIIRDPDEGKGTIGRVIDLLLQKPQHHFYRLNKSDSIFTLMPTTDNIQRLRVIIDSGAHFKGIPNRMVAHMMSALYANPPFDTAHVKYVLYFNEENILYALPVHAQPEQVKPILLGTTENITDKLKCQVNEYVTYYDQNHRIGVDIPQGNAIALLALSNIDMYRDFAQSALRLRDIASAQDLYYLLLDDFVQANPLFQSDDFTLKDLFKVLVRNQANRLVDVIHDLSGTQAIRNVFQAYCHEQIEKAASPLIKSFYTHVFDPFLFETDTASHYEKYGFPSMPAELYDYFTHIANHHAEQLRDCLLEIMSSEEAELSVRALRVKVEPLIQKYAIIGKQTQKITQRGHENPDATTHNQIHSHQENQNENENVNAASKATTTTTPADELSWPMINGKLALPHNEEVPADFFRHLEAVSPPSRSWQFSEDLFVSHNYSVTYRENPDRLFDKHKKPLLYNLVYLSHSENPVVRHVLITQKDAIELRQIIQADPQAYAGWLWVETVGNVPYAGRVLPPEQLPASYFAQKEQIYFLNGDIGYLIGRYHSLTWMKEQIAEKLDFLEHVVLRCHPNRKSLFPIFSNLMKAYLNLPVSTKATAEIIESESGASLARLKSLLSHFSTIAEAEEKALIEEFISRREDPLSANHASCKRKHEGFETLFTLKRKKVILPENSGYQPMIYLEMSP